MRCEHCDSIMEYAWGGYSCPYCEAEDYDDNEANDSILAQQEQEDFAHDNDDYRDNPECREMFDDDYTNYQPDW